jgi:uncharacterized protein YfdQ (DUF2303 family)
MFDKDAISLLQQADAIRATSAAVGEALEADGCVALPSDSKLHDLESFKPLRRRARGCMETILATDFAHYTTSHAEAGASVFVDGRKMQATAVLNLGTPAEPGHADNLARLSLQPTAAYSALHHINAGPLSQATAAEFLEDWPDFIKCFNDAGEISKPQAVAAVRKLSIDSLRKMESSVENLSASKSAFESVQATSSSPIPTLVYFKCEPYSGLAVREFVLRLGITTTSDKPHITLRIIKKELHTEEMAKEFAGLVSQALSDKLPVHVGSYTVTE